MLRPLKDDDHHPLSSVVQSVKTNRTRARQWWDLTLGRAQPENDSQRRYTRILQSAVMAFAGRGVAILVSIISIPLTVSYLGTERYGVWVTLSTLLAWLTLADLGLGNGLLNAVAEAYGHDRADLAQRYVATTFWILVAVAAGLGLVAVLLWSWLDWAALFNVSSAQARAEVGPAVALAIALTLISLPLSVMTRVLAAYQEGAIANYWAAIGNVASLAGILLVSRSEGGLPGLVLGFSGAQTLVAVVSVWWLFTRHKPWLWPHLAAFDGQHWRRLFQTGVEFFLLQVAALVLFQTDNLVIAHFLGSEHVTSYSIVYRLFNYLIVLQAFFLGPLWPAYAEAMARGDWPWIRQTFHRTLVYGTGVATLVTLVLSLLAEPVIRIWTRGIVTPQPILVWLIATWTWLALWGNLFAFLENGIGRIRIQVILGLLMAVVNLVLSVLWVQQFEVIGVIAATVVAYGAVVAWVIPLDVYWILHKKGA